MGGSGIGLSLVRELVHLMQGGLAVRNRSGRDDGPLEGSGLEDPGLGPSGPGAEFIVRLPLTRQAPLADDVLPAPVRPGFGPGRDDGPLEGPGRAGCPVESGPEEAPDRPLLLLVEDNNDVATYIQSCLRGEYQLIRAENGQIGIDQALATIPDLIVSDVMMPAKDGFELCDTLKNDERTSHIPIVLLTARAAVNDRMAGLRRGSDAYLVKPFGREELLLVLGNLLQTRRMLQRYYSQRALGKLQASLVPTDGADAREDQFVAKLRSTLERHLDNVALDTNMICELMGMSRNALYRKTMALTGLSIIPYLRALRLQKAEALLMDTELSVAEVAYAVGFDNPRYFSRVFSEEKGVSPSSFRNME